jgi:hypothetical protein
MLLRNKAVNGTVNRHHEHNHIIIIISSSMVATSTTQQRSPVLDWALVARVTWTTRLARLRACLAGVGAPHVCFVVGVTLHAQIDVHRGHLVDHVLRLRFFRGQLGEAATLLIGRVGGGGGAQDGECGVGAFNPLRVV